MVCQVFTIALPSTIYEYLSIITETSVHPHQRIPHLKPRILHRARHPMIRPRPPERHEDTAGLEDSEDGAPGIGVEGDVSAVPRLPHKASFADVNPPVRTSTGHSRAVPTRYAREVIRRIGHARREGLRFHPGQHLAHVTLQREDAVAVVVRRCYRRCPLCPVYVPFVVSPLRHVYFLPQVFSPVYRFNGCMSLTIALESRNDPALSFCTTPSSSMSSRRFDVTSHGSLACLATTPLAM